MARMNITYVIQLVSSVEAKEGWDSTCEHCAYGGKGDKDTEGAKSHFEGQFTLPQDPLN